MQEEERTSGGEGECEPPDSGQLPADSWLGDRAVGSRAWVTDNPAFKLGDYLAGSPGIRSAAMDALAGAGLNYTGPNLVELWTKANPAGEPLHARPGLGAELAIEAVAKAHQAAADFGLGGPGRGSSPGIRAAIDALAGAGLNHTGPNLVELWTKANPPHQWHAGPGLGATLATEAADRARDAMAQFGVGFTGRRTNDLFARAVSPAWEGLHSPTVSELARSFLPAGPDLSALSGFTAGIAGKMFAGPDLGTPSRLFLAEHLHGAAEQALSGDQWPWAKWSGASVFDGVTAAMHRHVQGMSSWMENTHQAWMDGWWRAPEESIAKALQSFSALADQGVAWGWRALGAALRAQRAVLRGDLEAIVRFLREWLGFKKTPHTLVDAASAVLLEEGAWLPAGLAGDDKLCPLIKKLTVREHRNFRLIGDTQLVGRPVDSLDRKVRISEDEAVRVPLVEVVPAPPPPARDEDISDPRLVRIIGKLNERERKILRMKALEGRTWGDAAVSSGATLAEGESLRRKVKRLSKTAQTAAPAVTVRAVS